MNIDPRQLLTAIAGPPLPDRLPPVVGMMMRLYRLELRYALDQIKATNPAMTAGVYIDIVDELAFNALAYANEKAELVGINAGVAAALPLIANWLLSQPGSYTEIGDCSQEIKPSRFDGGILRYSGKASTAPDSLWPKHAAQPRDAARRHFVTYMTTVPWHFLLYHELAHIMRCHLWYISDISKKPTTAWFELGSSGLTEKECQTRRILEVDADGVAGRILSGAPILNGLEKTRMIAFGEGNAGVPKWDWPAAYRNWLRPIGFLFQMMAVLECNIGIADRQRTHPHPDIRMQVLVNSIWPQWRKVIPDRGHFVELTREASREMQDIVRIGILPNPPSRTDEAYKDSFADEFHELWESLHDCAGDLNALTEKRFERKRAQLKDEMGCSETGRRL